MTIRVGTDLQAVDEVADALRDFGSRYTDRVFTARDLDFSKVTTP